MNNDFRLDYTREDGIIKQEDAIALCKALLLIVEQQHVLLEDTLPILVNMSIIRFILGSNFLLYKEGEMDKAHKSLMDEIKSCMDISEFEEAIGLSPRSGESTKEHTQKRKRSFDEQFLKNLRGGFYGHH